MMRNDQITLLAGNPIRHTAIEPRNLNWAPKTYHHSMDIYLKDSNAYGNVYFARYFEWQGVVRERWFHDCITPDMLVDKGVLITKEAHQNYVGETFAFQRVDCQLNTYAVKQCSIMLLFRFTVGERLISSGHQQIVFANHQKRIQRFPKEILEKMRAYEVQAN
jgi:enediyne core biosynthesis thioesterase